MSEPIPGEVSGKQLVLSDRTINITTASVVAFVGPNFNIITVRKSSYEKGGWNDGGVVIPGGKTEECDATFETTATREFKEESGIELSEKDIILFGYREYDNARGDGHAYFVSIFDKTPTLRAEVTTLQNERLAPPTLEDLRTFIGPNGPRGPLNHRVAAALGFSILDMLGFAKKNMDYHFAAREMLASVKGTHAELVYNAQQRGQSYNIITPVVNKTNRHSLVH